MTSLLVRLQKLNKEGTQFDWQVFDYGSRIEVASPVEHVCEIDASYDTPFPREQLEADAALIVECRNSLPAVLNLIEAAQALQPYVKVKYGIPDDVVEALDVALAVFVTPEGDRSTMSGQEAEPQAGSGGEQT